MAKKESETKDLATQGTQAVGAYDYGEHAAPVGKVAAGFEHHSSEDTSIPFISLLQPISPVVVQKKVPGAESGMWMNTITQELFANPKGLLYVPSTTRHEWVQFKPRAAGGGFVDRYAIDSDVVAKAKAKSAKFGEYYVDNEGRTGDKGDELSETFYVFGVACDEETPLGVAVIAFKGTMIRAYKTWMTVIRQHTVPGPGGQKVTPPIFAHLARMTSDMKTNSEGTFYVPVVTPAIGGSVSKSLLAPTDERFKMALACRQMVEAGAAKVNYDKQTSAEGGTKEENVPF